MFSKEWQQTVNSVKKWLKANNKENGEMQNLDKV